MALKIRAGQENTSVNALAECFLDTALKTPAPDDSCLALVADREGAIREMYRKIILGQTFGVAQLRVTNCVSCSGLPTRVK